MDSIWQTISNNPTVSVLLGVVVVLFVVIVIPLIVIFKHGDEERTIKFLGNEIHIKGKGGNKSGSSDDNNADSQTTTVVNVNMGGNPVAGTTINGTVDDDTLKNIQATINHIIDNFSNQLDSCKKQNESTITTMRDGCVSDTIQDLQFHFSDYFNVDDTQFKIKEDMFNLVMTYEFNKIMISKLHSLEKSPQSAYDELNSLVEDATKGICKTIENKLNGYLIFSQAESRKKFKEMFDSSINLLSRKITEFLKAYIKKTNEMKNNEREIIENRNKNIEVQLKYILNLKKGIGGGAQ